MSGPSTCRWRWCVSACCGSRWSRAEPIRSRPSRGRRSGSQNLTEAVAAFRARDQGRARGGASLPRAPGAAAEPPDPADGRAREPRPGARIRDRARHPAAARRDLLRLPDAGVGSGRDRPARGAGRLGARAGSCASTSTRSSRPGIRPKSVVVAAAALGDYTAFCRGALAQPVALLVRDGGEGELAVFVERQLVASHALARPSCPRPPRSTRWCGATSPRSSTSVEAPVDLLVGRLAQRDAAPRPDGHARPLRARERTARGAAELLRRRRAGAAAGGRRGARRGARERRRHQPAAGRAPPGLAGRPLRSVAADGRAASCWRLVYGGSIIVRDEMTRRALAREVEELEPQVAAIKKQEADVRKFQTQLATLTENQDRRTVHFLKELTDKIPADAYLTTLRYRNNRVEMDGFATKSSELIQILENSPMFKQRPVHLADHRRGRAGRSGSRSSPRSKDERGASDGRRFSARERRLIGAAGGVLGLFLVHLLVISPFLSYRAGPAGRDRGASREARERQGLSGAHRRHHAPARAAAEALSSRCTRSSSRATRRRSPPPTSRTRCTASAGEKGVEIQSTQVMRDDTVGEFRRIAVRITVTGDLKPARRLPGRRRARADARLDPVPRDQPARCACCAARQRGRCRRPSR